MGSTENTGVLANSWQTTFPRLGTRTTVKLALHEAFDFLSVAVNEIDPALRFNRYNHCPHFPTAVTCICDVVPVGSVGGDFSKELYSGYYSKCVYKILVVTDLLGHVIAWSGLSFGVTADVRIARGLLKSVLHLRPGEVMLADGAFGGLPNVIVPFRKPAHGALTAFEATYNKIQQMNRARIEHFFGRSWLFGVMKNIWQSDAATLTKRVRILLHFMNFDLKRGFTYRPLGPWDHISVVASVKVMASLIIELGEENAHVVWQFIAVDMGQEDDVADDHPAPAVVSPLTLKYGDLLTTRHLTSWRSQKYPREDSLCKSVVQLEELLAFINLVVSPSLHCALQMERQGRGSKWERKGK